MANLLLSVRTLFEDRPKDFTKRIRHYDLEDDLTLSPGEIVGLFGISGVGKTEFIRLLTDLLLLDQQIRLQYLPQELPLFPEMSVRANVKALSSGRRLPDALSSAPELGARIRGRERWSPATLSGGEKRSLVLIAATSAGADLLMLDETLISLDSSKVDWLLTHIREQVQVGSVGAVLIVSHDHRVLSRCDRVYEVSERAGKRCIRASAIPAWLVSSPEAQALTSQQHSHPIATHLPFLLRTMVGALAAVLLLLALLSSPRIWAAPEIAAVVPSVGVVATTFADERWVIAREAWWSFKSAMIALLGSILLGAIFCFLTSISARVRRLSSSTWIALQSVPVILFSPLFVILWGYNGRALEIAIGVFISVFPLGLIGARALATTPPDLFRAHSATGQWRRFTVAVQFASGDLVRAVISCAPLPAVGVIVAEYLIRRRGLGNLVSRGLTDTLVFDRAYAYVIACVLLALALVVLATVAATMILPRDISAD